MAIWPELPVLLLGQLVQAESRLRKLLLPAEPVLVGNVEFEEYAAQVLKLAPERRRPLLVRAFDRSSLMYRHGLWLELEGMRDAARQMYRSVVRRDHRSAAGAQARWRLACLSTNRVETVEHLETLAKECPAASTAARSALRRILHAEAATARTQAASIRASYAGSAAMKQRKKAADDAQAALHAAEQLILRWHPTSHVAAEVRWDGAMAALKQGQWPQALDQLQAQLLSVACLSLFHCEIRQRLPTAMLITRMVNISQLGVYLVVLVFVVKHIFNCCTRAPWLSCCLCCWSIVTEWTGLSQGIAKGNLQSAYAAGALYWNGRIEKKRGHDRQAVRWWRRALRSHPQSYYGWSAAACLQPGLSAALSIAGEGPSSPVGEAVSAHSMISSQQQQQTAGSRMLITDISTAAFASTTTIGSRAKLFFLRRKNPDNAPLPVGSIKLRHLYSKGDYKAAWDYWHRHEYVHERTPSVAESITQALLRLGLGDTHVGLMELASAMARANTPLERRLCKQLEKCQGFLRAVYPLPQGIQDDSKQSVSWDKVAYWSKQYNVDPLLVMAVIRQESQFNAKAMSHVGARGLMQLMPETAKWIAECARVPSYDLMNAADSVRLGSWYVAWVSRLYGGNNLVPAIAAYNAGPGLVDDWLSRSKAMEWDEFVEQLPFGETKYYVKSVLGAYWTYHRLYNNGERGRRLRAALACNRFLGIL